MPVNDLRPWERQEDEGSEAFEAFEIYLHMGTGRTLAKVGVECGKHPSLMERWSARHTWQRRLVAYDRYQSRIVNDRVIAGTAAMRERIALQGQNLQTRAAARVLNMSDDEVKRLNVSEVVALFRAGAEMEQKARAVSAAELDQQTRDDAPSFKINFLNDAPDEMISVRLKDGTVGFIPMAARKQFEVDHPDAVVIA